MPANIVSTGSIDTTPVVLNVSDTLYPDDRNGTLARVNYVPPSIDGIFFFSINGEYFRRVIDGPMSASYCGIYPDGTDQTAQIAAAYLAGVETIVFDKPEGGTYIINGSLNLLPGKVLKFYQGNKLGGTGTINNGIIDAGFNQHIFDTTLQVNPEAVSGGMISARWFGEANNLVDDQKAIQAAINLISRNNAKFTVVYLPGGVYTIARPIACAKYNPGTGPSTASWDQICVTLKGEGTGYSTKFPSKGTRIVATFDDRPAIWWQIGKSGGAESLSVEGQYVPPALTAAEFYNTGLDAYLNPPLTRQTRFSPYCGIAIDAVRYTGIAINEGYKGADGLGGNFTYEAGGMGDNRWNAGSSGLSFKDLHIKGFTVCAVHSPNGEANEGTQNADCITWQDIKVENYCIGFSSCQDQEKGNKFERIVSWGVGHTLFDNVTYGKGTSGHIIVDGVNLAGRNNQFINWNSAGRFPCAISNVYAEALGKFGTCATSASQIVIRDSVWCWCRPEERGEYFVDWHINATIGVSFIGCSFKDIHHFLPTILRSDSGGGATFTDCYFDAIPLQWVQEVNGSTAFNNCTTKSAGRIGVISPGFAHIGASLKSWSSYGQYNINDRNTVANNNTLKTSIEVNSPFLYKAIRTKTSAGITLLPNLKASFVTDSGMAGYHVVGNPVYIQTASAFLFAGFVHTADNNTNTVTIKFLSKEVQTGTVVAVWAMCPLFLYGGIGDLTWGSNTISNFVPSIGLSVGNLIVHGAFIGTGCAVVTSIAGATVTVNNIAQATLPAVALNSEGVRRRFTNSTFAVDSGIFAAGTLLSAGDIIESFSFGNFKQSLVTKSGFFNAVSYGDSRQAEWSVTNLPTIIDRFFPGDPGKPANGSTTYQNRYLMGCSSTDFTISFNGAELPYNVGGIVSYTFDPATGTITITNGTFDAGNYVIVKGR